MTIDEAKALVEEAHQLAYRGHGWYALGRGGTAWARQVVEAASVLGLIPVGYGQPDPGQRIYYLPTGTVYPGGPRSRTKHYFGRWQAR